MHLAAPADGEQPQAPLLAVPTTVSAWLMVDIDHGGAARLDQIREQPQLGGESMCSSDGGSPR